MEIQDKIKLIKFIDDVRYQKDNIDVFKFETSYYCFDVSEHFGQDYIAKKSLTKEIAEKILLTHYLLYICDRQMNFQYIFKSGGYVISQLVETFLATKDVQKTSKDHIYAADTEDKECYFKANLEKNNNKSENLIEYLKNIDKRNGSDEEIKFKSRFCPVDILCIFKTLSTLQEKYHCSFAEFIKENDNYKNLSEVAKQMYDLTYKVKQVSKEYIKPDNLESLITEFQSNKTFNKYSAKRIWCVLRDFLYHPYCSECYRIILNMSVQDFDKYKKEQIKKLELPGDVWNNNITFAKCFWGKDKFKDKKKYNSSKFTREELHTYKNKCEWNPINFDITFLYVPKMCNERNCSLCPFYKDFKLEDICHKTTGKYCSFLLYSTGIKYKCPKDKTKCEIHNLTK